MHSYKLEKNKEVLSNITNMLVYVCGNWCNLQLVEGGLLWSRKVEEVKAYFDVQHFALSNQIKSVFN